MWNSGHWENYNAGEIKAKPFQRHFPKRNILKKPVSIFTEKTIVKLPDYIIQALANQLSFY